MDNIEELKSQLARKEQECEKIKNWVKGMMFYTDCSNWFERFTTAFEDWKNDLTSQLDQLKKTNEELQKENEDLKRQHNGDKGLITSTGKINYQLIQEYDKLKKCLTEIKEIAENTYCLTNYTNKDMAQFAKQILQKISEVQK